MTSPENEHTLSAWGSGKLILFGEHAVVYGHPAVAVALPQGLKVQLKVHVDGENPGITCDVARSEQGHHIRLGDTERMMLNQALIQALVWVQTQGLSLTRSYRLSIEGSLPFKVGLGSSAAIAVATLRVLAKCAGHPPWSEEELFEGAMEMERVFHVKPSGLDHQVSIVGGALCYQRLQERAHCTQLKIAQPLAMALTWVPRQGSTADAVRGVAERREQHRAQFDRLFVEIGQLAQQGLIALERGQLTKLGELLNQNHHYLQQLGVSTPRLDMLCQHLRNQGALGAKMSGAGHGGVCLGVFPTLQSAQEAAESLTTPHWVTMINAT